MGLQSSIRKCRIYPIFTLWLIQYFGYKFYWKLKNIRGNWYFRCPVDNTWSNHVFDDNAVQREVLSLKTNCTFDEKCEWSGELRDLQVSVSVNLSSHFYVFYFQNQLTGVKKNLNLIQLSIKVFKIINNYIPCYIYVII